MDNQELTPANIKINDKVIEHLLKFGESIELDSSSFIFRENDDTDDVYIIIEGQVEVLTTDYKDSLVRIALLDKGSIFGEMSIFLKNSRSASIRTTVKSTLLKMNKKQFLEALTKIPAFTLNLMNILTTRLFTMNKRFVNLTHYKINMAIAFFMKNELILKKVPNPIKLNPKEVAEKVGLDFNEFLKGLMYFEREKIIINLNTDDILNVTFGLISDKLDEFIEKTAYQKI
ncbi:MAG: cyclic nucleotide-binding domain-containing protein [Calditerrivibrio sp.]|nr:cyclic nucleotide-binding domain-containing protein [Calditerrivibrio sp.]MCA1931966.1 cyclic nucleotide-binding domain-containing protein [Calditerrivibrio sp.]